MQPNIGIGEIVVIFALCCLPTAAIATLGALIARLRAKVKRNDPS